MLTQDALFGDKVTTSFVYIGFPETDPGFQFNAAVSVPEPSNIVLACLGGLAWLSLARRSWSLAVR